MGLSASPVEVQLGKAMSCQLLRLCQQFTQPLDAVVAGVERIAGVLQSSVYVQTVQFRLCQFNRSHLLWRKAAHDALDLIRKVHVVPWLVSLYCNQLLQTFL